MTKYTFGRNATVARQVTDIQHRNVHISNTLVTLENKQTNKQPAQMNVKMYFNLFGFNKRNYTPREIESARNIAETPISKV